MLLFAYTAISLLLILFVSRKKINISLLKIILFAIFLRWIVILIFLPSSSEDLHSFLVAGQLLLDDNPKYISLYFPFFPYLGAIALLLKNIVHPYLSLKFIFSIADVMVILPIYYLAKRSSQAALVYALNPISIIAASIHGQFDVIPLLFFMTGIYLFLTNKLVSAVLFFSFGIYTKTWPLLFMIPLIKLAKIKWIFLLMAFFPLLFSLIHSILFQTSVLDIFNPVKNYRGLFGVWGWTKILAYTMHYEKNPLFEQIIRRVFLAAFVIFSFLRKDKNVLRNILTIMLFFFSFTPTFGIQWLTWMVPLLLIVRPKLWRLCLIILSIYLAIGFVWDADSYFRSIMTFWNSVVTRVGIITWLFLVFMFLYNIKQHVFFKAFEDKKN